MNELLNLVKVGVLPIKLLNEHLFRFSERYFLMGKVEGLQALQLTNRTSISS